MGLSKDVWQYQLQNISLKLLGFFTKSFEPILGASSGHTPNSFFHVKNVISIWSNIHFCGPCGTLPVPQQKTVANQLRLFPPSQNLHSFVMSFETMLETKICAT